MESVTLKALQFYRKDVQKQYDKVDAIVNGNHVEQWIAVRKQFAELVQGKPLGELGKAELEQMHQLATEEKRLARLVKANNSKNSGKWCDLKIELEEIDREIANINWRMSMRNAG
ncbi:hypothetical protein ACPUEK_15985 [Marinomonas gallaica]|uniref:hypothetical protein n=1 Tax=Marinomonas gallaica TaxID=1806667 RepID=UPI003CE5767E